MRLDLVLIQRARKLLLLADLLTHKAVAQVQPATMATHKVSILRLLAPAHTHKALALLLAALVLTHLVQIL